MPRRYRKHFGNRDKYSIEQTNIITPNLNTWTTIEPSSQYEQSSNQYVASLLPPSDIEGMRKVKHLTVSFSCSADTPIFYAIAYVPQGYNPQPIHVPQPGLIVSNYPANQFIMSSGVLDFSGGPLRIRSRLSRNLNSGDSIYLILAYTTGGGTIPLFAQVSYAVTLQ